MKISTKGRYALRILLYLAEHYNADEYISIKDLAEAETLSPKYLERIMNKLVRSHFVTSARGSHGGYKLTEPPASYTVGKIIRVTEGDFTLTDCLNKDTPCPRAQHCATVEVWRLVQSTIEELLDNMTLVDLLRIQEEKQGEPSKYLQQLLNSNK